MKSSNDKIATHVGERGDHPLGGAVGAAVGAAAGAAAVGAAQGAALGTVAGIPGIAAGIAIGGVVGALAGKAIGQEVNPTTEDAYWSENYNSRPYIESGSTYDTYQPAYRHGVDSFSKNQGRSYSEAEPTIKTEWESNKDNLPWEKAQPATKDAYDRLHKMNTKV